MSRVLILAGGVLRLPCVELSALRIRCIGIGQLSTAIITITTLKIYFIG